MPSKRIPPDVAKKLNETAQGLDRVIAQVKRDYNLDLVPGIGNMLTLKGDNSEFIELALDALENIVNETKSKSNKTLGAYGTVVWTYRDKMAKHFRHLFFDDLEVVKKINSATLAFTPDEFNPMLLEIRCEQYMHDVMNAELKRMEKLLKACVTSSVPVTPREKELAKKFEKRSDDGFVYSRFYFGKELVFYGRTKENVSSGMSAWDAYVKHEAGNASSVAHADQSGKVIPVNTVSDLRRLKGGIKPVIRKLERDFLLNVDYNDEAGTMTLYGRHDDILQMSADVLVHMASSPDSKLTTDKMLGTRGTVIWSFKDNMARHFNRLFSKEIGELRRIETVYVRFSPTESNPLSAEVKCGQCVYEAVNRKMVTITESLNSITVKTVPVEPEDKEAARDFEKLPGNGQVYCRLFYSGKEFLFFSRTSVGVETGSTEWDHFRAHHLANTKQDVPPPIVNRREKRRNRERSFLVAKPKPVDKTTESKPVREAGTEGREGQSFKVISPVEEEDEAGEVLDGAGDTQTQQATRPPSSTSRMSVNGPPRSKFKRQISVTCPVCKDGQTKIQAQDRKLMSTRCGHVFCQTCIEEALKRDNSCPKCDTNLTRADVNFVTLLKY